MLVSHGLPGKESYALDALSAYHGDSGEAGNAQMTLL